MDRFRHIVCQQSQPRNQRGRDFVVGDLHGHRAELEAELERAGFDTSVDRLFCAGDLVDRGPRSLDTLALLEAPWFHAVMGNHELMLLNYLGCYSSRHHSRKSYHARGGAWVEAAWNRHRKMLLKLADRVKELPLVLTVEAELPMRVMHTGLDPQPAGAPPRLLPERLKLHEADLLTSSRRRHAALALAGLTTLEGYDVPVDLGDSPFDPEGRITYVGHSPTRRLTVHDGHVYLEQGVGTPLGRASALRGPTLVEHASLGHWLRGVMAARADTEPPRIDARTRAPANTELLIAA